MTWKSSGKCLFLRKCSILSTLPPCFSLKLPSSPQTNRVYLPLHLLLFAGLNWWYWLFLGGGGLSTVLASVPVGWLHASPRASLLQPVILLDLSAPEPSAVAKTSGLNQVELALLRCSKQMWNWGDEWERRGRQKKLSQCANLEKYAWSKKTVQGKSGRLADKPRRKPWQRVKLSGTLSKTQSPCSLNPRLFQQH